MCGIRGNATPRLSLPGITGIPFTAGLPSQCVLLLIHLFTTFLDAAAAVDHRLRDFKLSGSTTVLNQQK